MKLWLTSALTFSMFTLGIYTVLGAPVIQTQGQDFTSNENILRLGLAVLLSAGGFGLQLLQGRKITKVERQSVNKSEHEERIAELEKQNTDLAATLASEREASQKRGADLDYVKRKLEEVDIVRLLGGHIDRRHEETAKQVDASRDAIKSHMDTQTELLISTLNTLTEQTRKDAKDLRDQIKQDSVTLRATISGQDINVVTRKLDAILGHLDLIIPRLNKLKTGSFDTVKESDHA